LLLHSSGSLLSLPAPNGRPLDYLHAMRRLYSHALPFWWDGSDLMPASDIDQLMVRMQAACAIRSEWRTKRQSCTEAH